MADTATIPWGATGAMRASKRSSATLERQGQERGGGSPFALQRAGDKNAAAGYLWSASARSTDLFFSFRRKTISVSSAAKRQWGLQRGKLGSPLPCFGFFCRGKRNAAAASRANQVVQKTLRRRQARSNYHLSHCRQSISRGCAVPAPFTQGSQIWGAVRGCGSDVCAADNQEEFTCGYLTKRKGAWAV